MTKPPAGAWLMWGLAATFYAYGFFQRVAPSVMVDDLMRDLDLGGALLGTLSAAYFYTYAAVQVPIGILVDRLGVRRLLVVAVLLAAFGSLVFAAAPGLATAVLGRGCVGIGVGAAYVAALKTASVWFPIGRFGLMAGLTLTAGLAGAIGAQAPLAALVQAFGWRPTALAAALVALLLALTVALLFQDRPRGMPAPAAAGHGSIRRDILALLRRADIWLLVAFTGTIAVPVLTFAGLWGVPYLVQVHGLARAEAGAGTSVMLAAWAVGGPLAGWLSERVGRRRSPMAAGAAAMLFAWTVLLFWPRPPLSLILALFLVMGLAGGFMIVAFAHARDICGLAVAGTAMGIVNSGVLVLAAAGQTLFGYLLDLQWDGATLAGARVYEEGAYRWAFATFVVTSAVALAGSLALRETHARPTGEGAGELGH